MQDLSLTFMENGGALTRMHVVDTRTYTIPDTQSVAYDITHMNFRQSINVVQKRCSCAVNEGLRHRFIRHTR